MSTDSADRRFTLIVIVLLFVIVSGTILTALKVVPSDTMTHMLATIVGLIGGALTLPPNAVQVKQAIQSIQASTFPPENRK